MKSHKLTFENKRTCTIECEETGKPLQDKINEAENRFGSPVVKINDKEVKEHSLGGFLLGAVIGGALGNSVAKSGVKKTASKIGSRTKKAVGKAKKDISEFRKASTKKFSGGGGIGLTKNDIEILGVPRNKISEKEWESILRMAKYQNNATYILKDSKGLDIKPQIEYEWYVKEKYSGGGVISNNEIADNMEQKSLMSHFADEVRNYPTQVDYNVLENILPDYIAGKDITYVLTKQPDNPYFENGGIIKFSDGFSFKKVSKEYAEKNFQNESIFGINDTQETESLIESKEDINRFDLFGIEIGFEDAFADGGLIGKTAIFERFGEQKIGTITEDLGNGKLVVVSGMGQYAVTPDNLISITEPIEKKGFFSFGEGGKLKYNRSWHQDHNRHNKAESYEKPMSERSKKFNTGGSTSESGFNWSSFSINELLAGKPNVMLSRLIVGGEKWIQSSDVSKVQREMKFTLDKSHNVVFGKGNGYYTLEIPVQKADSKLVLGDMFTIVLYTKENVKSLKAISSELIEKFENGGKITKQSDGTYTHPSGYVIEPAYDKGRYILLDPDGMDAVGESMTLKEAKETLLDNVENYEFGNGGYLVQYGPGNKQTIISTKSEADDFVKTLKEKGHTNIKVRSKSEYKKQYESTSEDIKMDLQKRFNINPHSYAVILSEKGKWKISPVNIKEWINKYGSIETIEQEISKKYKKFYEGGSTEYNRSWHQDHNRHNKAESYEKPMSERSKKFSGGGGISSVKKYRLLSPDGFDIEMDKVYREEELMPAFEQFKKRFEKQGYYSTGNRERINLSDLGDSMTVIETKEFED